MCCWSVFAFGLSLPRLVCLSLQADGLLLEALALMNSTQRHELVGGETPPGVPDSHTAQNMWAMRLSSPVWCVGLCYVMVMSCLSVSRAEGCVGLGADEHDTAAPTFS